jgi:hypothetical protein
MQGHHRERISRGRARNGARLTFTAGGRSHLHPAWSLLERRCHDPLLAVSLEEVLDGSRSPFVPPRGPWCIPAAAPVKGRFATGQRSAGLAHRSSHRTGRPHPCPRCGHSGQVFVSNAGVECAWREAARRAHHPAMAGTGRSCSALATSNHSDMAAH